MTYTTDEIAGWCDDYLLVAYYLAGVTPGGQVDPATLRRALGWGTSAVEATARELRWRGHIRAWTGGVTLTEDGLAAYEVAEARSNA